MREIPDRSLREFAQGHEAYELSVPYLDETLWFVPRSEHISILTAEGVRRGRIWTAAELADLLSIPAISREEIQSISRLKAAFGAEILSVTPDDEVRKHE